MKPLSPNEGWAALCLFAGFGVSGILASVGLMPFWVPVVVWLVFALGILFRPVLSERVKKIISGKHDSGTE